MDDLVTGVSTPYLVRPAPVCRAGRRRARRARAALARYADAFRARAETTISELKAFTESSAPSWEDVRALGANHPAWRYVAAR